MTSPITAIPTASIGISVSTSTASAALPAGYGTFYIVARSCDMFVKWGAGSQSASASFTGHMFLPSGSAQVLQIPNAGGAAVTIAAITDSGTGMLAITPCTGGI